MIGTLIKFAIGAVFGAGIGFWFVVQSQTNEPVLFFGGIMLVAIVCGWFSAKLGIEFWEAVRDYHHWPFRRD